MPTLTVSWMRLAKEFKIWQKQSAMLDQVNSKMERVTDRMENVNKKMKDTLEEVGRASDKLCVDIMCIVLAVGFGAVMYNFIKNDQ